MTATFNTDKFVTLLVNEEFAVDTFISLATQAPYSVRADGTMSSLEEEISKTD